MRFKIVTKYGTVYEIDEDGCFLKYDEHTFAHPHETWKCTGVAEILPFNNLKYYSLKEFISMIISNQQFTFKNGYPKFTLTDIDHGTHRTHGNIKVHGINFAHIIL